MDPSERSNRIVSQKRSPTSIKKHSRTKKYKVRRIDFSSYGEQFGIGRGLVGILGLVALITAMVRTASGSQEGLEFALSPLFPWWGGFILEVVFIAANGCFIAALTALEGLKAVHVKLLRDEDDPRASIIQKQLDMRSSSIASLTIAIQSARFLIVVVSLALVPHIFMHQGEAPIPMLNLLLETVAIALPILIINMIIELAPKSYATMHPIDTASRLSRVIRATSVFFLIPARAVTAVASLLTSRFGLKASFSPQNQAEEEIKTIAESAQESGEIEEVEREMIHSVFEFSDTVVREVMTPRVDIDALPIGSDAEEVMNLIRESGHSRIPLFEENYDAIAGIVHAKDLLMAMLHSKEVSLQDLMRQPLFVPENKSLHDLLRELRQSRSQMAIVQDEFGGTSGLVTIEDIVEEVVGDIVDEYDEEEPDIVEVGNGYLIDAKTHLDDVSEELEVEFETEEFDTIGGYIFGLFGRQPALGESIEDENFKYTVAEIDGRRIVKVRIDPLEVEVSNSETSQNKNN